ncbi:cation efflux family domain-containing protein [Ditylenchus destructor]|uniref:Cation efflux family domain-containing protein n=1 Tax=Ditylenchus destructor TaxID=166010 RepID=A0AAD4N2H2_9BILA|nr:cation efflux family domain-containing protein [Ditylenchus destructor]
MHPDENCALLESMDQHDEEEQFPNGITPSIINHCHALLLQKHEDRRAEKVLRIVAILSAVFIVLEFTGGYLANSLSIMTDAGHMLSDFLSFIVSIVMIRVSRKPASRRFPFGLARANFVGALMSVFVIWTLTTVLVIFATQRILSGQFEIEVNTMIVTACLSVIFNIIMVAFIKLYGRSRIGHCHGMIPHTTGESHASSNVNVRAAFIHILGDFMQSIGVLVAAICIKIFGWNIADPICTYIFSLVVMCTTIPVFKDIICVFMESIPSSINYSDVYRELMAIDGVIQVHSLQIWTVGQKETSLCAHLVIDAENAATGVFITKNADMAVKRIFGISYSAIQVELSDEFSTNCSYCKPLP